MVESFTAGDVLYPGDFAGDLYCPPVYDEVRVDDVSRDSVTLSFVDVDGGVSDSVSVTLPELAVMLGWPDGCEVSDDDAPTAEMAGVAGHEKESSRGVSADAVASAVVADVRSRAMRNLRGRYYALRGQDVPFPGPGEELDFNSRDFSLDDPSYPETELDGCCVTMVADASGVAFVEDVDECLAWLVSPELAADMYTDGRLSRYGFYVYDHVAVLSCDDPGDVGTDRYERIWDRPTVVSVLR